MAPKTRARDRRPASLARSSPSASRSTASRPAVSSPLSLAPRLPVERRFLIGGVADRLVPPDQVRDLWLHWDRPLIAWYQGGHMTFNRDREVRRLTRHGLEAGGLIAGRTRSGAGEAQPPLRNAVG